MEMFSFFMWFDVKNPVLFVANLLYKMVCRNLKSAEILSLMAPIRPYYIPLPTNILSLPACITIPALPHLIVYWLFIWSFLIKCFKLFFQ